MMNHLRLPSQRCIATIRHSMKINMLKLNDDKTEFLVIHPKSANQRVLRDCVTVGNARTSPTTHASNLGVTFHCTTSLERHVTNIYRAAYYHLHSTGRIRHGLSHEHTKQLVHVLVISRIDCCNSLLNGLSETLISKLQRVQNACARVIMIRPKRDHVTTMLRWLPVKCRLTFKTLLLTFKNLHGRQTPLYIYALFSPYCLTRSLQPSDKLHLKQPTSRTKIGEQAFSYAAPRAWNELPSTVCHCTSVGQFIAALKPHIKSNYFGCKSLIILTIYYFY